MHVVARHEQQHATRFRSKQALDARETFPQVSAPQSRFPSLASVLSARPLQNNALSSPTCAADANAQRYAPPLLTNDRHEEESEETPTPLATRRPSSAASVFFNAAFSHQLTSWAFEPSRRRSCSTRRLVPNNAGSCAGKAMPCVRPRSQRHRSPPRQPPPRPHLAHCSAPTPRTRCMRPTRLQPRRRLRMPSETFLPGTQPKHHSYLAQRS